MLNEKQQQAFDMATTRKLSILTGAPGTGKTYTLKEIHRWGRDQGKTILQAAPTGKAAKQMQSVTGRVATTIHKLLEVQVAGNGEFSFRKGIYDPISCDMLVLDECSMITNNLMARVMDAIDFRRTSLLLIGDHYQLPSVGAGAVLRDLIDCEIIPTIELTEIQRNSGDIVKACHRIKDGKGYEFNRKIDLESGKNLVHIEASDSEAVHAIVKRIVCQQGPERGYDPVNSIQVLSPTNTITGMSCDALNQILQANLNPSMPIKDFGMKVGDKIINTKNRLVDDLSGSPEMLVNGDIGFVKDINIDKKWLTIDFVDPLRTVLLRMYDNHLLLAYAITVHRFQGSEAPVVIFPIHSAFSRFLTRNWLYTAISRAKEICFTVGQKSAIRRAINTTIVDDRVTMLKEKIWEGGI
jgi:exodeoxyribonuclease V alpha subunit